MHARTERRSLRRVWRSRHNEVGPASRNLTAELVIASGEMLWVEDGRADPRFADEVLVKGPPHLRGCVGAPIRLENGSTPGVPPQTGHLRSVVGLVWRSVVLWMLLLALLSLANLVG